MNYLLYSFYFIKHLINNVNLFLLYIAFKQKDMPNIEHTK